MKRRNFLISAGTTILGGTVVDMNNTDPALSAKVAATTQQADTSKAQPSKNSWLN